MALSFLLTLPSRHRDSLPHSFQTMALPSTEERAMASSHELLSLGPSPSESTTLPYRHIVTVFVPAEKEEALCQMSTRDFTQLLHTSLNRVEHGRLISNGYEYLCHDPDLESSLNSLCATLSLFLDTTKIERIVLSRFRP